MAWLRFVMLAVHNEVRGWQNCHPLVHFAPLSLLHAWSDKSTVSLSLRALVIPWRGCLTSERLVPVCSNATDICGSVPDSKAPVQKAERSECLTMDQTWYS